MSRGPTPEPVRAHPIDRDLSVHVHNLIQLILFRPITTRYTSRQAGAGRLLGGAGGEERIGSSTRAGWEEDAAGERPARMADDAASMETDEGGAEMSRALAGAKVG